MKKALKIIILVLVVAATWMAFVRKPLPAIPAIIGPISQQVDLNFSIGGMDYDGLELELNNKPGGKGMYVEFGMGNAFRTGRAGLVLKAIREKKGYEGKMSTTEYLKDESRKKAKGKGKDFEDFMQDKKGTTVKTYTFKHTLVEGNDGKTYMQMIYSGPAMNMIDLLEIPRPVTVPAHVSRLFTEKGILQFERGTYALDSKSGGFNIPVTIR